MTSLLIPLLGIGDFFNTLMWPLYTAVSAVLVGAYHLWSPVTGENSGWTWMLSIISLTVVIRTLLIPLFVRQINSARSMQALQPKLKALQDKHGADREKLGRATMDLYREEGVNPAASCFPVLLQMPIFIALYTVLNGAAHGNPVGYFFEQNPALVTSLTDSSVMGARLAGTFWPVSPFGATQILAIVLIISMTAVLFITQLQLMSKNMPPEALTGPMAQSQKMMLYVFPIMYLFMGVSIPVGVLVYWLVSNLWTLVQQWLLIHNNPTPNTPAYIEWEERMIRKGRDPKKIAAERIAKRRKTPAAATTSRVVQPQAGAADEAAGDAGTSAPVGVQRQQIQRQQPRNQTRSTRKRPTGPQTPPTPGATSASTEAATKE